MLKKVRIILTALLLLAAVGVNAQVTTASMAGKVTDASNEPIIGATVQAVHQPSGSRYGTVTNVDGRYSIQGMRTGGPYRVEISYIGYQTVIYKDITLQLGEVYNLNVEMSESSELLNEVIVTAAKTKFTAEKTGATTNISSAQMTQLPTVNRSISDIARLSPYANGMSFAGGDGRSTNFTIDGANFNNNFGLSSNLPGGGNPISMDAIEEVQVVVAPFDVRQTNFIGGGINAITKSGTNTFRGTAYTYYRNQDMRGNRINGEDLGARSDCFPRTIPQAECLTEALNKLGSKVDYAIDVDVPDSNIVNRMSGRRACLKCGATYHVVHAAPKVEGVCDTCGEKLVLRDDDQPETVQKRLNVYHEQTQPLIDYYTKEGILKSVDGTKDLEEVFADIVAILGE